MHQNEENTSAIETELLQSETGDNLVAKGEKPGQKLKRIREELGLSHARVAESLHMTAHYVNALEKDQYNKLPGKIFVKGYFKSYAKLLNADVDEILQSYENHLKVLDVNKQSEAKEIRAKENSDQNVKWMIFAGIVIVIAVALSWWFSK